MLEHRLAHRVGHDQELEDASPASVAFLLAPLTTYGSIQRDVAASGLPETRLAQEITRRGKRLAAAFAQRTHEPLGNTPLTVEVRRKSSTPMSSNRVTLLTESFVCKVENT